MLGSGSLEGLLHETHPPFELSPPLGASGVSAAFRNAPATSMRAQPRPESGKPVPTPAEPICKVGKPAVQ